MKNTRDVALQVPESISGQTLVVEALIAAPSSRAVLVPLDWWMRLLAKLKLAPRVVHLRVSYPDGLLPSEVDHAHGRVVRALCALCGQV